MTSGPRKRSRVARGLSVLLIFIAGGLSGAFAFHALTKPRSELSVARVPETAPPATPVVQIPPSATPASAALVATVLADQPRNGALLVPVLGVKARQLSDTFNETRGSTRRHEALDILAPRGTPVIAADDGRIVKLFKSVPGGLTIYQFDPSERLAYYYAHLEGYAIDVTEGRQVQRGEVIGYVGTTGNANPATPHLHFAIFELGPEKRWWKGTAINPYPLLTGR